MRVALTVSVILIVFLCQISAASAVVIHTYSSSCYFTIGRVCPVESILGTLAIGVVWAAVVIGYRLLKHYFGEEK